MAIFWGFQTRTAKRLNKNSIGTSLMVQWLTLQLPTQGSYIPGLKVKIPLASAKNPKHKIETMWYQIQ